MQVPHLTGHSPDFVSSDTRPLRGRLCVTSSGPRQHLVVIQDPDEDVPFLWLNDLLDALVVLQLQDPLSGVSLLQESLDLLVLHDHFPEAETFLILSLIHI